MKTGFVCNECGCKDVYARLQKRELEFGYVVIAIRCKKCFSEYSDSLELLGIENNFHLGS